MSFDFKAYGERRILSSYESLQNTSNNREHLEKTERY